MMKYMAWIFMALLIQAILANPTPANEEAESISGVRCTHGYTLSNNNGRCEKIVTITCQEGKLDLRESFITDCEEADEDPEGLFFSISAVRCTHGFTLSNNGRCEKIITITVEEEALDLCELFGYGCLTETTTKVDLSLFFEQ